MRVSRLVYFAGYPGARKTTKQGLGNHKTMGSANYHIYLTPYQNLSRYLQRIRTNPML